MRALNDTMVKENLNSANIKEDDWIHLVLKEALYKEVCMSMCRAPLR